jgi:hypothetical protein
MRGKPRQGKVLAAFSPRIDASVKRYRSRLAACLGRKTEGFRICTGFIDFFPGSPYKPAQLLENVLAGRFPQLRRSFGSGMKGLIVQPVSSKTCRKHSSARMCRRKDDETYISAFETRSQTPPRIPCTHGHQGRPQGYRCPPRPWPQAPFRLIPFAGGSPC